MGAAVLAHFSAFSYTMALIQLPLLSYTLLIIIHGYFLACHHLPQPLHKSFARLDVGITHLQDVLVVFWILSGNFVWYMTWYRSCVESESGLVWLLKLNDSSVPHSLSWCNMVATYIVPEFFYNDYWKLDGGRADGTVGTTGPYQAVSVPWRNSVILLSKSSVSCAPGNVSVHVFLWFSIFSYSL